jgi:hypothetical protein
LLQHRRNRIHDCYAADPSFLAILISKGCVARCEAKHDRDQSCCCVVECCSCGCRAAGLNLHVHRQRQAGTLAGAIKRKSGLLLLLLLLLVHVHVPLQLCCHCNAQLCNSRWQTCMQHAGTAWPLQAATLAAA